MELVMETIPGGLEAIKEMSEKWNIIIFTAKAKPDRSLVKRQVQS